MKLFLVRHPPPRGVHGLCYGRRDVALDGSAFDATVSAVRRRLGRALCGARIVSSPATRCRLLARALAAPHAPTVDAALQEIDFGTWEGLAWDAVPRAELDAWAADVWRYAPGGGESAAAVAARWRRWCAALADASAGADAEGDAGGGAGNGADGDPGGGAVVVVTHAGVIRVALHGCGALSDAEFVTARIGYGSVHRIALERAVTA